MANTEVIQIILDCAKEYFTYMLPVMGVLAGIVFIAPWIHASLFGMGSRSFRG